MGDGGLVLEKEGQRWGSCGYRECRFPGSRRVSGRRLEGRDSAPSLLSSKGGQGKNSPWQPTPCWVAGNTLPDGCLNPQVRGRKQALSPLSLTKSNILFHLP